MVICSYHDPALLLCSACPHFNAGLEDAAALLRTAHHSAPEVGPLCVFACVRSTTFPGS